MGLIVLNRILLSYAVVLATLAGVCVFSVVELRESRTEIRLVSEGYLRLSQNIAAVETYQSNRQTDIKRTRDATTPESRLAMLDLQRLYTPRLIDEKLALARTTATAMREFAPADETPFIVDLLKRIEQVEAMGHALDAATNQLWDLSSTRIAPGGASLVPSDTELDGLARQDADIAAVVRLLYGSVEARIQERVRRAEDRAHNTEVAMLALPAFALAVGVLAFWLVARSLRPIKTLAVAFERIRRGDFEAKTGLRGSDEIGHLGQEFDAFAQSLKDREALLAQKQRELLESERLAAVGRVSAQVAHEVRNPLSSIGLNVEMLSEHLGRANFATQAQGDEVRALLGAVTQEIDRVTEITEDYLHLARIPAPTLRSEDVVAILRDVLSLTATELARAKVQVETTFPPNPIALCADQGQLRQVFLNLIRNAREAMEGGGVLTVTAWRMPGAAHVRISDTGKGVAVGVRDRIFEAFFTTKRDGTGLGLSLSRQIVESHGGSIVVEGSPGGGATFVLTLPAPESVTLSA